LQHTMKLVDQLPSKRPYIIYTDNYYTSMPLLEELKTANIRATGTFRKGTSGFPSAVKSAKLEKKGDTIWRTLRGEYSALKWQDTKGVLMASNFMDPSLKSESESLFFFFSLGSYCFFPNIMAGLEIFTVCFFTPFCFTFCRSQLTFSTPVGRRDKNGEKKQTPCPKMVVDYNQHMGYVDEHGQRISNYKTNRVSKKWWRSILFWVFDCVCYNAFLVYEKSAKCKTTLSYRKWLFRLHKELVAGQSFRKRKIRQTVTFEPTNTTVTANKELGHYQMLTDKKVYCSTKCGKQTKLKCAACGKRICSHCWSKTSAHDL